MCAGASGSRRRDVLDAVDGLAELGDLGVDDGLHVDLDVPIRVGDGRRLRDLDGLPGLDLALLRGGQLVEDLLDVLGVPEDAGDIREQQVRQEPAAHDLAGLEHLREGQDLGGVELDHPALGVLAQDREEVQQPADVLLPHALVARGVRVQVVGEGVEDRQRALGREVEDVRVLLLEHVPGTLEGAGVLRPERRLHVLGRGGQVGQHDDRGPLGHRDARGQLSHRQGDGLAIRLLGLRDGRAHLVQGLAGRDRVGVVVGAPVAGGQDDRVVLEDVVLLEQLLQCLGRGDAVEQPEGVADLVSQLRRGERVLLVGRQAVEELDDLGLVLEEPVVLGREELVEVERVVDVRLVLVDSDALGQTVRDHPRDLVGQQVERRQRRVRVLLAVVLPLLAGGLLVLVRPVEDLVLVELAGGERLERRARQVQRPLALDLVERDVGLGGVDALVGLVDHQQVPVELSDVLELVVRAAEVLRPLEVLQREELHDARVLVQMVEREGTPLLASHGRTAGQ